VLQVSNQLTSRFHNKMRPDQKKLLDELGFLWRVDRTVWKGDGLHHAKRNKQHEKLVEFEQMNGHCMVPCDCKRDKSLGRRVVNQWRNNANSKMRPDWKELLDKLQFIWKADALAARSSAMDARGLVIGSFHALGRSRRLFLTLILFMLRLCVIPT
jgi:hypothetical protein